ncbi:unnamed protein product [Nesidiocoris tenuis]|uniref:Uncharacterized protein n=1 Tax=Nesidiocoris tenuis TaxID=355587 RepID=A0A6H5G5N2_9HEMI|nr:unnamed protein product [Nesidiocoris tenuis]
MEVVSSTKVYEFVNRFRRSSHQDFTRSELWWNQEAGKSSLQFIVYVGRRSFGGSDPILKVFFVKILKTMLRNHVSTLFPNSALPENPQESRRLSPGSASKCLPKQRNRSRLYTQQEPPKSSKCIQIESRIYLVQMWKYCVQSAPHWSLIIKTHQNATGNFQRSLRRLTCHNKRERWADWNTGRAGSASRKHRKGAGTTK